MHIIVDESSSRNNLLSVQQSDLRGIRAALGSPLALSLGQSRIGGEAQDLAARDHRGVSFCDTMSLSKTSYRSSNNSSLLEDESSSSDAGISSHDDEEFDRLNRIRTMDDEDLDYKIKWFFDRAERQAAQQVEKPSAPRKDDFENLDATIANSSTVQQEASFSSNPIESDSHSTNEESSSHEDNSLLGKRSHSDSFSLENRKKDDEAMNQYSAKRLDASRDLMSEEPGFSCFFPQFEQDLKA